MSMNGTIVQTKVELKSVYEQVFDRADFANTLRPGPVMYTGHGGTYAPQSGDLTRAGPPGKHCILNPNKA